MAWTATPIMPPAGQLGWRAPMSLTQAPPLMQATAGMPAPSVSAAIVFLFTPPSMVAVAVLRVPTLTVQGPPIAVPKLTAVALMPAPTVRTDETIAAAIMTAAAQFRVPVLGSGATALPPALAAGAAMLPPAVSLGVPAFIAPPAMLASAQILTPTVGSGKTVAGVVMSAIAAMLTPGVSAGRTVSATVLAAIAAMPAPTIGIGAAVGAPLLTATAAMPAPALSVGKSMTSPVLTATAVVLAGSVGTGATVDLGAQVDQALTDNFVRADSTTSAGPNWTNRVNTVGIQGNTAYPNAPGGWAVASYNTTLSSDDMDVSVTYGTCAGTDGQVILELGCNAAGQGIVAIAADTNSTLAMYSQSTWALTDFTQLLYVSITFAPGDVLTLSRRGNVYRALKNGNDTGCNWTDSTDVMPRGPSYRYVGFGGIDDEAAGGPRHITAFQANNASNATASFTDNFVRADSTASAGPGWVNHYNAKPIGISGNTAYGVDTTWWCLAKRITPLNADDADVSITLADYGGIGIFMGCDVLGNGVAAVIWAGTPAIYTCDHWLDSALTLQTSLNNPTNAGDTFTLRRRGNVYSILQNGTDIGCTWVDSTNIVPINANHRYVGMSILTNDAVVRHVAAFQAKTYGGFIANATMLAPTVTVSGPAKKRPVQPVTVAIPRAATI